MKNNSENTPLMLASMLGHTEVIKELLRGISMQHKLELLRQKNKEGDTPLKCARRNGYMELLQELCTTSNKEIK